MFLLFGLLVVLGLVAVTLALAALLQLLWNMTLPDVFGFKTINYWQAFRLLLIAAILFGPSEFVRLNFGGNKPVATIGWAAP